MQSSVKAPQFQGGPDGPEQTLAQMIIIIHPGSLNLRIGRASDLNPYCILHAIGRLRKPNGQRHCDTTMPPSSPKTKELLQELEESRLQVSHTLQSCLQSDGRRRYATPPQQISSFNKRCSSPEIVDDCNESWLETDEELVIGDDVKRLDPNGDFNIHFPMKRGEFNLHSGIGGSMMAVLADLQAIWEYVLARRFGIDVSDLSQYKVVLVIPDIYNRGHLRELTSLLLTKMGFGSCFLIQDHVAATFGAGLGYACVVDVGDQKTSVSCVEDGISHANTRVRLEYGGGDVSQTFYWLLQKCAFPYKECDERRLLDAALLKTLKEEFCHVNLDVCGSEEKKFEVAIPGQPVLQYTLMVGDECIVAPLSLFHPELLGITGKTKLAKTQKPTSVQPDPEDCFDAEYLRETGRKGTRDQMEQNAGGDGGASYLMGAVDQNEEDIVVDSLDVERDTKSFVKEFVQPGCQIISLDQAVLQSIERCPNEEIKRKMYGQILVVGGGMKFSGIGKWLQNRVSLQIPYLYRSEHLDIVTSPKDMDPAMTVWKGAAVMSCLESAPELWLSSQEWERQGLKVLREKALFIW